MSSPFMLLIMTYACWMSK